MRIVKGNNAQGPEAAEHGEDGEAQVVLRGQHDEVVLTLTVAGAVTLQNSRLIKNNQRQSMPKGGGDITKGRNLWL